MLAVKITTIGSSTGVILTKEAMAHLKVRKGDTLYLTDAPGGGLLGRSSATSGMIRCRQRREFVPKAAV